MSCEVAVTDVRWMCLYWSHALIWSYPVFGKVHVTQDVTADLSLVMWRFWHILTLSYLFSPQKRTDCITETAESPHQQWRSILTHSFHALHFWTTILILTIDCVMQSKLVKGRVSVSTHTRWAFMWDGGWCKLMVKWTDIFSLNSSTWNHIPYFSYLNFW